MNVQSYSGRHSGLVVSTLISGFKPWPGTLCYVLGQDTLITLYSHSDSLHLEVPANCWSGSKQIPGKPSRAGELKRRESWHQIREAERERQAAVLRGRPDSEEDDKGRQASHHGRPGKPSRRCCQWERTSTGVHVQHHQSCLQKVPQRHQHTDCW